MVYMQKKRLLRLLTLTLALTFILTGIEAGPGAGISRADAGYNTDDIVYLTVLENGDARISWPEYAYSGYAYVLQVKIGESGFESIGEFSRAITSYDYTGAKTPNGASTPSVYVFRVLLRELRSGRDEAYYNEIIYKPAGTRLIPSNTVFEQISPAETRISWTYDEGAAYETSIERRREGESDFARLATVPAGVRQYIDAAIEPNTLYRYRIRAVYGYAVYSEYIEASVRSAIETPKITEIYAASPSSVYIMWSASSDAVRYRLERRLAYDAAYAAVTSIDRERTYYTDSGVIPGERYFYRVKAISQNGSESLYSDEVEITAIYIDVSQSISPIATGDYRVEISWADPGDKESAYEVWRYDEQFPGWKLLDITERNATGYIDVKVGPGERYSYRIRARSAEYNNVSRFSAEAYAETIFLAAPTDLKQSNAGNASINLTWKDNSSGENSFIIERRQGNTGEWRQVASVGADITERNNLAAPANSAWYFRVGAYSSAHRSIAYSEPILADNGFGATFRGSSYQTDGNGIDDAGAANNGSGSRGGGRGGNATGGNATNAGDIGGSRLDAKAVDELAKRNVIKAVGGAVSGGDEPVTRGEFVAMLIRALDVDEKPIGAFDDVKSSHPYYKEIMQAARLGFAKAEYENMFYPDRIVTRAEMVIFAYDSLIANATPLPQHGADALGAFPDSSEVPALYLKQTRAVFGEGIMIGIGIGSGRIIGIGQESTREQAALVIYRYMQWLSADGRR